MSYNTLATSWHPVACQLPFAFEDTATVNRCFARWRRSKTSKDKRAIDLWTYCYVNHYFRTKAKRSEILPPIEVDRMVERAFLKVQHNLDNVRSPRRFTHWVSVVCKHTLINHTRQQVVPVALEKTPDLLASGQAAYRGIRYDSGVAYEILTAAIQRLPQFLRETATLRFVRYLSYRRISELTGHSIPTVRTYVHKTTVQFQNDPQLQLLRDEILGP